MNMYSYAHLYVNADIGSILHKQIYSNLLTDL